MNDDIKNVYIGLPEDLREKVLWVDRQHRKNPLSFIPGGYDVVVEYLYDKVLGYDWIKYPTRYIDTFFPNSDSKDYSEIIRIFARSYQDQDFEIVKFEEIWNVNTSKESPRIALERFFNTKQYQIYNIRVKPIFDPNDLGPNGRGKGRFKRPMAKIKKNRLKNELRMKGNTIIKNKEIKVLFSINEHTFGFDIEHRRDLLKKGIYILESPKYHKANESVLFNDSSGISHEWDVKIDTIVAGLAIYKGQ